MVRSLIHQYRSRSEEAKLAEAQRKQKQREKTVVPDKTAQFGPPDRTSNFLPSSSKKTKASLISNVNSESGKTTSTTRIEDDQASSSRSTSSRKRKTPPSTSAELELDTDVKKKALEVDKTIIDLVPNNILGAIGKRVKILFVVDDHTEWYEGIVAIYNILSGKYGIFFPSDKETTLDDDDLEFID